MPSITDDILLKYDLGGSLQNMKAIESALKAEAASVEKLTSAYIKYNEQNVPIAVTAKAITSTGAEIIKTFEVENGRLNTLNSTITQNIDKLNALTSSTVQLGKATKDAQGTAAGNAVATFTAGLPTPSRGTSAQEALRFGEALRKAEIEFAKINVNAKDFYTNFKQAVLLGESFSAFKGNALRLFKSEDQLQALAAIDNLKKAYDELGSSQRKVDAERRKTGEREKKLLEDQAAAVRTNLQNIEAERRRAGEEEIRRLEKQAAKAREIAAKEIAQEQVRQARLQAIQNRQSVEGTLRGAFQPSALNTAGQLNIYERELQKILSLIEKGKISVTQFNTLLANSKGGQLNALPGLGATESQVVQSLFKMQQALNLTGVVGEGAGQKVFLAWQSVIRLFQVQLLHQVLSDITTGMSQATKQATEFRVAIAELKTIEGVAKQGTEEWARQLINLSSAFGINALDTVRAAYETISNQVARGAKVQEFMNVALRFAVTTASSAADSVNLLTSAINSFHLSANDAERIASVLFKTIDLGRVRASEMANTFGRVGFIANSLGVRLEEVSAAIATLTIRGIKFSEASTLINNVLLKMVKPSEELKELFKTWGVETGETAIATFGLGGVLGRLNSEAQKGTSRVAELFTEMRALRGIIGLSGDAFGEYQSNLQKINNAQDEFSNGTKTVMGNMGKQWQVELERIKNHFAETFGKDMPATLLSMTNRFGGLSNVIIKVTNVLITLVKGVIGYQVAAKAAYVAQVLWQAGADKFVASLASMASRLAGVKAATEGLNVAQQQQLATQNAINATSSAAGAAFVAGWLIGDWWINAEERHKELISKIKSDWDAIKNNVLQTFDKLDQEFRKRQQNASEMSQMIQRQIAAVRALNNQGLQSLKELTKESQEALKVSGGTFFDAIKNNIAQFEAYIRKANEEILRSIKYVNDLKNEARNSDFGLAFDFLTPAGKINQQVGLIKRELESVRKATSEALNPVNPELGAASIDALRKRYDDLTTKLKDLWKAQVEWNLEQGKPTFEINRITGQLINQNKQLAETHNWINQIIQERIRLETNYQETMRQSKEEDERKLVLEKEKLRTLEEAFKKVLAFEVIDKDGKLKFVTPEATTAEFEKIAANFARLMDGQSVSAEKMLDTYNKVLSLREKIKNLAGEQLTDDKLAALQDEEKRNLDKREKNIIRERDLQRFYLDQSMEARKQISVMLEELNKKSPLLVEFPLKYFIDSMKNELSTINELNEIGESRRKRLLSLMSRLDQVNEQNRLNNNFVDDPGKKADREKLLQDMRKQLELMLANADGQKLLSDVNKRETENSKQRIAELAAELQTFNRVGGIAVGSITDSMTNLNTSSQGVLSTLKAITEELNKQRQTPLITPVQPPRAAPAGQPAAPQQNNKTTRIDNINMNIELRDLSQDQLRGLAGRIQREIERGTV